MKSLYKKKILMCTVLKNNLKLGIIGILCLFTLNSQAQDLLIHGTVKDEQGVTLPGVSVMLDGTQQGTTTDANGKYSIKVNSQKSSLTFKYIGYLNEQIVVGTKKTIDVTLHSSTSNLDEVVVVGYGTQKKSDIVSSVVSIKAEDATRNVTLDVGEMLRGKAAGLQVTTSDAGPGGSSNIVLRGNSSLKGGSSPIVIADGVQIGAINDLNPNDIASIEVLKDAAAQAIYGSRASNGVILITTKRGVAGKTTFNYGGYYGTQTANRNFDVYNGQEFAQLKREADRAQNNNILRSDNLIFSADELAAIAENRSIDWSKEILQPATIQNHDFSVSSGTEKTKVYLSGNYQDMIGLVPTTNIRKGTLRANIDQDIKSWLTIGLNSSYQSSKSNDPGVGGMLRQIVTASPLGNIYNPDGTLNVRPGGNQESFNPLLNLRETNNDKRARNDILNVYVDIKPFKGFKNRINASRRSWNYKETNYNTKLSESGVASGTANGYIYFQDNREWLVENITTYDKSIDKHNLNFTTVLSASEQDYNSFRNSASKIPNDILGIYGLEAALINLPNIDGNKRRIVSAVGRIQYDYASKYYLTLSGRADGASVFGANNKSAFFPAVAVGWNIYKEDFMSGFTKLTNLKLRGSYGSVGNQAISPYGSLSLADQRDYIFGANPVAGYVPGSVLANPDLKWETSTTLNGAVDFGFYNGRLSGTVELYDKRTTNLLVDRLLNQATGYSRQPYNIGEIQNKGVEFQLNTIPVKTKDFKLDVGVLFSKNINKIISLYGKDNNGDGVEDNDVANGYFIGQPIEVYNQPKFIGIWQGTEVYPGSTFNSTTGKWEINGVQAPLAQINGVNIKDPATGNAPIPGAVKLEDRNNDGKISSDDNYITSKYPKWTGSLNLGASYRNFDFSMDIYTVQGVTKNNQFLYDYTAGGDLRGNRNGIKVDYWTPENPSNTYPQPNAGTSPPNMYNLGLQDASYWRLQNVTIGYTFPTSITSKLKISNLKLYASGQNLITNTEYQAYSPEQDLYAYPTTRNFIFGLKVGL
nr:TonB-dependent receptor [uncultured Pedobacter sp.]